MSIISYHLLTYRRAQTRTNSGFRNADWWRLWAHKRRCEDDSELGSNWRENMVDRSILCQYRFVHNHSNLRWAQNSIYHITSKSDVTRNSVLSAEHKSYFEISRYIELLAIIPGNNHALPLILHPNPVYVRAGLIIYTHRSSPACEVYHDCHGVRGRVYMVAFPRLRPRYRVTSGTLSLANVSLSFFVRLEWNTSSLHSWSSSLSEDAIACTLLKFLAIGIFPNSNMSVRLSPKIK